MAPPPRGRRPRRSGRRCGSRPRRGGGWRAPRSRRRSSARGPGARGCRVGAAPPGRGGSRPCPCRGCRRGWPRPAMPWRSRLAAKASRQASRSLLARVQPAAVLALEPDDDMGVVVVAVVVEGEDPVVGLELLGQKLAHRQLEGPGVGPGGHREHQVHAHPGARAALLSYGRRVSAIGPWPARARSAGGHRGRRGPSGRRWR